MKTQLFKLAVLFGGFFFQACAQQPANFNSYVKELATGFKTELSENKTTNASYAVFTKDSVIFEDSFSANKSDINTNTPFLIGSVTKVFTAVAVMQLYEQGKIDIDKPVSDYVPDFKIKQRFPESSPNIS